MPGANSRYKITKKDWADLQQSVDVKGMVAFVSSCRGCVDLPSAGEMVEFSDGTKISIEHDPSDPPPVVRALLERIKAIESKQSHSK